MRSRAALRPRPSRGAQAASGGRLRALPAFNSPLLSASLREFWGGRWNLTAGRLLRACAYQPMRGAGVPAHLAAGVTFVTSGLAHEAIVFYGSATVAEYCDGRVRGQWLAFFAAQGALVAAERAACGAAARALAPSRPPGPPVAASACPAHALGRSLLLLCRRCLTLAIVLQSARVWFLPPAYALGWPWQLSQLFTRAPRAAWRALARCR